MQCVGVTEFFILWMSHDVQAKTAQPEATLKVVLEVKGKDVEELFLAQLIRPQTLNCEVPGSNLLASGSSALGQGTLSSLPSPLERYPGHWYPGCLLAFLVAR